jgi:hypothetical protein
LTESVCGEEVLMIFPQRLAYRQAMGPHHQHRVDQ